MGRGGWLNSRGRGCRSYRGQAVSQQTCLDFHLARRVNTTERCCGVVCPSRETPKAVLCFQPTSLTDGFAWTDAHARGMGAAAAGVTPSDSITRGSSYRAVLWSIGSTELQTGSRSPARYGVLRVPFPREMGGRGGVSAVFHAPSGDENQRGGRASLSREASFTHA